MIFRVTRVAFSHDFEGDGQNLGLPCFAECAIFNFSVPIFDLKGNMPDDQGLLNTIFRSPVTPRLHLLVA